MRNLEIAKLFHEIADLLEIKDDNVFRIRAYRRAAMNLDRLLTWTHKPRLSHI